MIGSQGLTILLLIKVIVLIVIVKINFVYCNRDEFQMKDSIVQLTINNRSNKSIESDHDHYQCDEDDDDLIWEPEEPIVTTKWSKIKGFTRKLRGIKIAHFLGIPYAQPPIGQLRFKKPRPLISKQFNDGGYYSSYDGQDNETIYEAFSFGPACMQKMYILTNFTHIPMSEDCLFINVYTPLVSLSSPASLPVTVHIHGSAFVYLSSADPLFYGGFLSAMAETVVVTFNYRLGVFGHMFGHDQHIPGNQALYDQRAALIWVRQNIDAFGGDPGQVTLSGHSSGATFAALHLFSTQSRYLFKNVAILSGAAIQRSATDSRSQALAKTRKFLGTVNCRDPIYSSQDNNSANSNGQTYYYTNSYDDQLTQYEIDCLLAKEAYDLIHLQPDALREIFSWNEMCSIEIFLPFYGNTMFPESIESMLYKGNFRRDISIIFGRVPVESARGITKVTWSVDYTKNAMREQIRTVLRKNSTENVERILEYYFHTAKSGDLRSIAEAVFTSFNDFCWHCPNLNLANLLSKQNRVYLYSYTYKSNHLSDLDLAQLLGAYHTEDVSLIFGFPYRYCSHYSDNDRAVSSYMVDLWSNFIYTGAGDWPSIFHHYSVDLPFHQQITGIYNQKVDKLDDKQYICGLINY